MPLYYLIAIRLDAEETRKGYPKSCMQRNEDGSLLITYEDIQKKVDVWKAILIFLRRQPEIKKVQTIFKRNGEVSFLVHFDLPRIEQVAIWTKRIVGFFLWQKIEIVKDSTGKLRFTIPINGEITLEQIASLKNSLLVLGDVEADIYKMLIEFSIKPNPARS